MYKITKTFHFSASHIIRDLNLEHPESTLHGHNFTVIVEFRGGKPNQKGFIFDTNKKVKIIQDWINEELQRKHLNDVFGGMPPTNECMCHWLFYAFKGKIVEVSSVEIFDEPGSSCKYEE